ncbi:MAG: DUF3185 domain-containing protein [Desulfobacterales bacterium]|nr:DUF3185 domain-containing protein [Desulfobacterales bacterium]
MKTTYTLIGIIHIMIGIIAFGYQGISFTNRGQVVNLSPIHKTDEKTRTLPISPIIGGNSIAGGIVLLVMGKKKEL